MNPLPALLEEVEQRLPCPRPVDLPALVQDAGCAVDAEPTLTRPHRQPQQTANVIEACGVAFFDRVLEARPGDQLTLADDLLGLRDRLASGQAVADLVELVALRTGERTSAA